VALATTYNAVATPVGTPPVLANNNAAAVLAPAGINPAGNTVANQIVTFNRSGSPSSAVGPRPAPKLIGTYQSPSGFPVSLYLLGNGHRVIIEQRPTDAISLRTFIDSGSINERAIFPSGLYSSTDSPSGLAHLDEHCHFLTTQNFPNKYQWTNTIAGQGAQFNATTSTEFIQHEMTFNQEDTRQMLAMHGEAVMRPLYQPNLISLEKTNVINEIGERHRFPEAKIHNELTRLLFERPDFQTSGVLADIQGATVADLNRFHKQWYTPTHMVTVVSGNVDPAVALQELDRQFGSNPPQPSPSPSDTNKIALNPAGEIRSATIADPQLNYSAINLAFPAPAKAQFKDRAAMQVLALLLGDGPLSLLQDSLKTKQQLVSDVGVSYEPMKKVGSLEVVLHTQPGQEQQTLQQTLGLIGQLSQQPISPQQLQDLKKRLINGFDSTLENGSDQNNAAEAASMNLGSEALTQSLPYYLSFKQWVNSLTPADIQRVATEYLKSNRYAVVFGIPSHQRQTATQDAATVQGTLP
jgi:zinc protease